MLRPTVAGLALVLACGGSPYGGRPSTSTEPIELALHRVLEPAAPSSASGYDSAETVVIRTAAEWQAVWTRLHAGTTPVPALPAIDFADQVVVLVAVGTQSSGGHRVEIDRAVVEAGEVRIHAVHVTPGSGCGVTMALTQPVDVVRLTTTSPTIVFEVTRRAGAPCPMPE